MLSRRFLSLVPVLLLSLGLQGCAGVGFTLRSMFRSSPDYDALEAERRAGAAGSDAAGGGTEHGPTYWNQYRGPRADGIYDETALIESVPAAGPPELWRVPVGPAYSSVVVAGGRVITLEQRRDREVALAFGLEDGRLVWEHGWEDRFADMLSKEGPRATPAVLGELVFVLGGVGELRALDLADGALRWRRDLLEEEGSENLGFGTSASPRLRDGLVVVQGARSLWAFEAETGEPRWRALDEELGYATPQLARLLGRDTWIVTVDGEIVGVDAEEGRELWRFPWKVSGGGNCTQPLAVAEDRVLVSSGYGKGSQLVALRPGAAGVEAEVLWRSGRFKTRFSEPVLRGPYAFGLDESRLACLEVASGKQLWKQGSYGYGQLLAAGERLVLVDAEGDVHLLEVGPEGPVEHGSFPGLAGGITLNLPALAHGRLFLRNERELVAFDLRPPGRP